MVKKMKLDWGVISVFLIAEVIYLLTLEPSTSLWDCSEFISCAGKLEVGHAPGAPLFLLLGRFFALFAFGDTTQIAYMVNALSATASALTISLLYGIIKWLSQKIINKKFIELNDKSKLVLVNAAAFIGAISFAFTDSFWFSAVESEVYATSALFSALVLWCIAKWDMEVEEDWKETRWLLLIAFVFGLSVGVHLLNLLAIPVIVLVIYAKKYTPTAKGFIYSQMLSLVLLLSLIFGVIPGVAKSAALFDLQFVNVFGLPVYSGALSFIALLAVLLFVVYKYSIKTKKKHAPTLVLALCFWLVGYSSFGVLVIRSNANPFVDMNNVENLFGLVDYLNREQYPSRPLVKGNSFNSPIIEQEERYTYKLYDGKYHKDELNPKYVFDENTLSIFPRMASLDSSHEQYYRKWVDIEGRKVAIRNNKGEKETIRVPTLKDNIQFFFKYQMGHMYLRYFMWNFVGKQNDIQGHGGILNGNWLSGISSFDSIRLGDQKQLPPTYKKHKAHNKYYFLPLLLGLLGMVFQYRNDRLNFLVVLSLFILTGTAIVVYLNEVPITPRERDYVYVCSYMAFSMWIGIGVLAVYHALRKWVKCFSGLVLAVVGIALLVPLNMLKQNWNDHDRSGREVARDFAANTLSVMDDNAIFFTSGDNDTYPIWYIQEIEEYRQDIRHVIQTFLPMDWYANQLKIAQENKKGIKISYDGTELLMNKNNYFPIVDRLKERIDIKKLIAFLKATDKSSKVQLSNGEYVDFLPSRKVSIGVNAEKFIESCSYLQDCEGEIPSKIEVTFNKSYLSRQDVLLLDILAQNDWERPIYFISPMGAKSIGLSEYLHREGNVYRLMPFKSQLPSTIQDKQALMQYNIIMEDFKWGNISSEKVFLDHTNLNIIRTFGYHQMFAQLASHLQQAGENQKALDLLEYMSEVLPDEKVGYSNYSPQIVNAYYKLNHKIKGDELATEILEEYMDLFRYYRAASRGRLSGGSNGELDMMMYTVFELLKIANIESPQWAKNYSEEFHELYAAIYRNGQ